MAKNNWERGVGTNTYTMHNVHTGARQLEKFSLVFFIIKTVFSATPITAGIHVNVQGVRLSNLPLPVVVLADTNALLFLSSLCMIAGCGTSYRTPHKGSQDEDAGNASGLFNGSSTQSGDHALSNCTSRPFHSANGDSDWRERSYGACNSTSAHGCRSI